LPWIVLNNRHFNGGAIQHRLKLVIAAILLASMAAMIAPPRHAGAQQILVAPSRGVISVEKNETLFDTLSALYAAGYGADSTWRGDDRELAAYRAELRGLHGPAAKALRAYYRDNLLSNASDTLSRFVSFALVAGPPPNFPDELTRQELPPDVLGLEEFNAKLAAFYAEAGLASQWTRFARPYDRQVELLEGPVSKVVIGANGYLREVVNTTTGREFVVIVEPLIGSRTNFRIYGSRYTVIVDSAQDPPLDEIRHAYLHFLLDPLVYRYGNVVDTRRKLMDIAARAPRLPSEYIQDFPAFVTESMIKAIELRFEKLSLARLDEQFDANDANGFILVRPLYDGLQKFEQSDPAMTYYYPNLIESVSVSGTERRLQNFQFPPVAAQAAPPEQPPQRSEIEQWVEQGNDAIAAGDASGASIAFARVLRTEPVNISATYGLAVVALLKGDAETARRLFEQVTASAANPPAPAVASPGAPGAEPGIPELSIVAWSHVYLGRIHDLEGEREQAVNEYRAALADGGIPAAAKSAAEQGLQSAYHAPPRPSPAPKQ
jgi:tetratricopeptide (TPR) repeat protein